MAITWRNVAGPNTADVLRAAIAASAGIGEGIAGIGDAAKQFGADKTKIETDALIAELMAADTIKQRENMLASADPSFLNMERASERAYELGGDERDLTKVLAEEARAVDAEQLLHERDVAYDQTIFDRDITYEDTINTREIKEAEELLKDQYKREDYTTMMDQKFETETQLQADMQTDSEIETRFQNGLLLIEDEYNKNTQLDDLEFTRARSLITQEAQLKKQAASALAVSTAAKEEALALIEKQLKTDLKKLEVDAETLQKKNKLEAEQKEIKLKSLIKKQEKSGEGLEKILNTYSMHGNIEDTDFGKGDREAFAVMKDKITQRGISPELFDKVTGNIVSWNDNKMGFLSNPNDFSFTFRGVRETFGKTNWLNLGTYGLPQAGVGGVDDDAVNHLEAAILQSKNDKDVHDLAFGEFTAKYKAEGVEVDKADFESAWTNYVHPSNLGYAPSSIEGFMQSLIPPEEREGAVPGDQILLYKQ